MKFDNNNNICLFILIIKQTIFLPLSEGGGYYFIKSNYLT